MTKPSQQEVAFKRRTGRPKNPDIERRVLHVAGSFISRRGLDGVSMDEIAWKADISKATLYAYFRSKQVLFEAVLQDLFAHLPPAAGLVPGNSDDPIEGQLLVLAKSVNRLLASADFELARRALASDIPEPLRARIWKTAALPYLRAIGDYLLVLARAGHLDLGGRTSAASWFIALVAGGEALRSQWRGAAACLLDEDHLRCAVRLFIRGHAPQRGQRCHPASPESGSGTSSRQGLITRTAAHAHNRNKESSHE